MIFIYFTTRNSYDILHSICDKINIVNKPNEQVSGNSLQSSMASIIGNVTCLIQGLFIINGMDKWLLEMYFTLSNKTNKLKVSSIFIHSAKAIQNNELIPR